MFHMNDAKYKKLTVRLYPNGDVKGQDNTTFDFDKGDKEEEKYAKLCETYKKMSLDAQADTHEVATLTDETLKITLLVDEYAFTICSELVLPNVDYMKALAAMTSEELSMVDDKFRAFREETSGVDAYPTIFAFERYIRDVFTACGHDLNSLDAAYKILIQIHDSYTTMHKEAIFSIVKAFVGEGYTYENGVITITSADQELRKTMTDLAMSKYYDIIIAE